LEKFRLKEVMMELARFGIVGVACPLSDTGTAGIGQDDAAQVGQNAFSSPSRSTVKLTCSEPGVTVNSILLSSSFPLPASGY
jgi:hypothetical protein